MRRARVPRVAQSGTLADLRQGNTRASEEPMIDEGDIPGNEWSSTASGEAAWNTRLKMEETVRRWKSEKDSASRYRMLAEYTVLMAEWLQHTREHLRLLEMRAPRFDGCAVAPEISAVADR
jgi:hypothetical protein